MFHHHISPLWREAMPHLGLMVQYSSSPPFLHTYIVSKIGYWYSPYQLVQDFFHQKYHKNPFFLEAVGPCKHFSGQRLDLASSNLNVAGWKAYTCSLNWNTLSMVDCPTCHVLDGQYKCLFVFMWMCRAISGWWFQRFFIFTPDFHSD